MDLKKQNQALQEIVHEVSKVAGYFWQRGWAERNAGNISVNISEWMENKPEDLHNLPYHKLEKQCPALANLYFLVSGAEKRMRDLAKDPEANSLVIRIDDKGSGFYQFGTEAFRPTSEFPTHLGIHNMIAERGGKEKVVMHTHATELIALTQISEFCDREKLNALLMSMHPETSFYIPAGVGFVPFATPGSEAIARETINVLERHAIAIWEKHGVFAIGGRVPATFDLIDILAKSARIYFMVKSCGREPEGLPGNI